MSYVKPSAGGAGFVFRHITFGIVNSAQGLLRAPETRLALCFLPLMLVGRMLSGQFVWPSAGSSVFVFRHYVVPVLASMAIMFCVLRKMDGRSAFLMLALCFFSLFLHFNFKSWALLTGNNYDALYYSIDQATGIPAAAIALRKFLFPHFPVFWLYHSLFVFWFFAVMVAVTIHGKIAGAREANFDICLILMVGGVAYCLFPAYGPFVFRPSASHFMQDGEQYMLSLCNQVKATGNFPLGFFTEALGAMPSLHLADATLFLCLSWKYARELVPLMVLSFAYFLMDSMALGWHYVVDLPVGILLGLICFYIGGKINWHNTRVAG